MSRKATKSTAKNATHLNSKPPSDAATTNPNTGEGEDNLAYEGTRDGLILGFNAVKDVSEATELLAPLKATCALIIRGLETTRVK